MDEIKGDWQRSVQPRIDILERRVKRLNLKEVPFKIHDPYSDQELEYFIEKTAELDDELPTKKRNKELEKTEVLQQLPRFFESPRPLFFSN